MKKLKLVKMKLLAKSLMLLPVMFLVASTSFSQPDPPMLIEPIHGDVNFTTSGTMSIQFRWIGQSAPIEYELIVDNNADFNSPEVSIITSGESYTPTLLFSGDNFWHVRGRDASGWGDWTSSHTFFIGKVPNTTVISPNGGEVWVPGNTYNITWDDNNPIGWVHIWLYKGGVFNQIIADSRPSTGQYQWDIPSSLALGTDYRIVIVDVESSSNRDESDSDFSVGTISYSLKDLELTIIDNNFPKGLENSLLPKIKGAQKMLDKNPNAAKSKLLALVNEINAQKGKKINEEDANDLISRIQSIIDAIDSSMSKFALGDNLNNKNVNYEISQNYPNPFNPTTKINYSIKNQSYVTLKVFDVIGREVDVLVNKEQPMGTYEVEFNATNLTSGIYFYRVHAGDFVDVKKMILMK